MAIKKRYYGSWRRPFFLKRYPFFFVLLFSIITLFYYLSHHGISKKTPVKEIHQKARILEIHDGDTVTVEFGGAVFRARLIGIDAPEMGQEPWGEMAKRHLMKLIKKGSEVKIETDLEKFDRYKRLLIYLFTLDGTLVNEQLLRDGYGVLLTIPPNVKYVDRFIRAQEEAKRHKRGIWGKDGLKEMPIEYKKRHKRG